MGGGGRGGRTFRPMRSTKGWEVPEEDFEEEEERRPREMPLEVAFRLVYTWAVWEMGVRNGESGGGGTGRLTYTQGLLTLEPETLGNHAGPRRHDGCSVHHDGFEHQSLFEAAGVSSPMLSRPRSGAETELTSTARISSKSKSV